MGSRAGTGMEQVVASEASVMYRFKYLLSWYVISMQMMNKNAEGGKPQLVGDMRSRERSRPRPVASALYRTRECT